MRVKLQWKQAITVPTGSVLAALVLLAIAVAAAWAARDDVVSARRDSRASQAELQQLRAALERARADLASEVEGRQALLASLRDELSRLAEAAVRDHYRGQSVFAAASVESLDLARQGIGVRCRVSAEGQKPWHATVTFTRRSGRWVLVGFTEER